METQIPNLNVQIFANVEALTDYLKPLTECNFITQNDVNDYVAQKKEQMVLEKHTHKISQGQGKDTRWFTYVITQEGRPRTKLRANSREDLICKLYDVYFGTAESRKNILLPEVYPEWLTYRLKVVNRMTTVRRNDSDYKKYYVYVYLDDAEIADLFFTQAEAEGFTFGDGGRTDQTHLYQWQACSCPWHPHCASAL